MISDNDRTELAALLGKHYGTSAGGDDYLWAMADIIIGRGWVKRDIISTAEELDVLPDRAIVLDAADIVWRHDHHPSSGRWWDKLDVEENVCDRLNAIHLPAIVLDACGY